jgi:hypothetical protein
MDFQVVSDILLEKFKDACFLMSCWHGKVLGSTNLVRPTTIFH